MESWFAAWGNGICSVLVVLVALRSFWMDNFSRESGTFMFRTTKTRANERNPPGAILAAHLLHFRQGRTWDILHALSTSLLLAKDVSDSSKPHLAQLGSRRYFTADRIPRPKGFAPRTHSL